MQRAGAIILRELSLYAVKIHVKGKLLERSYRQSHQTFEIQGIPGAWESYSWRFRSNLLLVKLLLNEGFFLHSMCLNRDFDAGVISSTQYFHKAANV